MTSLPPSVNRATYAQVNAASRMRSNCASYARYEAHKAMWRGMHPNASPFEYEVAMRAIAKECGV